MLRAHHSAQLGCEQAKKKKTTRKQKLRFLSDCEIFIKLLATATFRDTAAQTVEQLRPAAAGTNQQNQEDQEEEEDRTRKNQKNPMDPVEVRRCQGAVT